VILKSLEDRHKNYVFSVFMPPPSAVKKELVCPCFKVLFEFLNLL
jgi:hypothetical protein